MFMNHGESKPDWIKEIHNRKHFNEMKSIQEKIGNATKKVITLKYYLQRISLIHLPTPVEADDSEKEIK